MHRVTPEQARKIFGGTHYGKSNPPRPSGSGGIGGLPPVPYSANVERIIRDGSHLRKSAGLRPNVIYQAGEFEYIYHSDEFRRIASVKAPDLRLTARDTRLRHDPKTMEKLAKDHAGHLIADRFGGSPKLDNMVSQLSTVNQSKYRILENKWAKALKNGKKVSVEIKVHYSGDSLRPDSFEVVSVIDGKRYTQLIPNN
jgi:hypothetical protein